VPGHEKTNGRVLGGFGAADEVAGGGGTFREWRLSKKAGPALIAGTQRGEIAGGSQGGGQGFEGSLGASPGGGWFRS